MGGRISKDLAGGKTLQIKENFKSFFVSGLRLCGVGPSGEAVFHPGDQAGTPEPRGRRPVLEEIHDQRSANPELGTDCTERLASRSGFSDLLAVHDDLGPP